MLAGSVGVADSHELIGPMIKLWLACRTSLRSRTRKQGMEHTVTAPNPLARQTVRRRRRLLAAAVTAVLAAGMTIGWNACQGHHRLPLQWVPLKVTTVSEAGCG
jgi:hypothetical protein